MAKRQSSHGKALIECFKCSEVLLDPRLLVCLHSACSRCIKNDIALHGKVRCYCGTISTNLSSVDDLPIPYHIADLVDHAAKRKADACKACDNGKASDTTCSICGSLCKDCVKAHKRMHAFRSHTLISTEQTQYLCKQHNKELELFCSKCYKVLCRDCNCYVQKHSTVALTEFRCEDLKKSVERLKKQLNSIDERDKHIGKAIDRARTEVTLIKEKMCSVFSQYCDELKKHELYLINRAKMIESRKLEKLEVQRKEFQQLQVCTNHVVKMAETCINSDNYASKASCHHFFLNSVQESLKKFEALKPLEESEIQVDQLPVDSFTQYMKDNVNIVSSVDIEGYKITRDDFCVGIVDHDCFVEVSYQRDELEPSINATLTPLNCEPVPCISELMPDRPFFKIKYKLTRRGRHKLSIRANGVDICSSPFDIMVYMEPKTIELTLLEIKLTLPYQAAFTSENHMLVSHERGVAKLHEGNQTLLGREQIKSTGIATDENGHVYISYESKGCVVKLDAEGKETARTEDNTFNRPGRLYYDSVAQRLYVCVRGSKCIQVLDTNLKLVAKFAENIRCADLVCEHDENDVTYYVSNKSGNNIEKFDKEYMPRGSVFPQDVLSAPRGLCIQNGHMFISDRDNGRIAIFKDYNSANPQVVKELKPESHDFGSISIDRDGFIYVCNERLHIIMKI